MILDKEGIIVSATEPVKNRKQHWFDTTNNMIYELIDGKYVAKDELDKRIAELEKHKFIMGVYPTGKSFDEIKNSMQNSIYILDNLQNIATNKGFPKGAPNYGTLITINPQKTGYNSWRSTQIYIPINTKGHNVYIRNDTNTVWSLFTGTKVEGVA